MANKVIAVFLGILVVIQGAMLYSSFIQPDIGANSKYGLPGIHNTAQLTLVDGTGVALAVDTAGRLIISTTTIMNTTTTIKDADPS